MTTEETFLHATKPIVDACVSALEKLVTIRTPEFAKLVAVQAADETGWNANGCAQGHPSWRGQHNWAGLSWQGRLLNFPTVGDYADAYAQSMAQDIYRGVWEAPTVRDAATALGQSPWAASHYTTDPNKPGLTLLGLLGQYATVLDQLYPGTAAPTATTDTPVTVTWGETLSEIAAAHGDTLQQVEQANPQITDPNLIHPGQTVEVPVAEPAPAPVAIETGMIVHLVAPDGSIVAAGRIEIS